MKAIRIPEQYTYSTAEVAEVLNVKTKAVRNMAKKFGIGFRGKQALYFSFQDIEIMKAKKTSVRSGGPTNNRGHTKSMWFFDGYEIHEYDDVCTATIQEDIEEPTMKSITAALRKCAYYYNVYLGCTVGFGNVPQEICDEYEFLKREREVKKERRPGEPLLGGYCGILAGR